MIRNLHEIRAHFSRFSWAYFAFRSFPITYPINWLRRLLLPVLYKFSLVSYSQFLVSHCRTEAKLEKSSWYYNTSQPPSRLRACMASIYFLELHRLVLSHFANKRGYFHYFSGLLCFPGFCKTRYKPTFSTKSQNSVSWRVSCGKTIFLPVYYQNRVKRTKYFQMVCATLASYFANFHKTYNVSIVQTIAAG